MTRFVGGLSERAIAVVLAVGAAQFPLYYSAYCNTLAGAKLEAETRYHELEREAAAVQLSVEPFIQRHENNSDAVFKASGRIHRTTLEHFQRYTAMDTALRSAPVWQRTVALAQNFDPELHGALRFEPGLPLTLEGGAYALAGLLLAWMLTGLARLLLAPRASAGGIHRGHI